VNLCYLAIIAVALLNTVISMPKLPVLIPLKN